MALGKAGKGPRVIASGTLVKVTPRTYADNEKNREQQRVGTVYATDYTLQLDDGAQVFVRAWDREEGPSEIELAARVGQLLTVWVEIVKGDTRFGDSFEFDGLVTPDYLDLIHSSQLVASGK